ncbi:cytokinin riboside 5'-monophosphate phosphoribohydrolase LOG7 isoform X2 [Arachis hypogaea]|uniref:cytokinin riboside 5'-monophosphate phosphoribohydrolase LOG7 isoform X2 n=1 Tax=Arachis hypogaea TaxID=3818 RepID=UPI0034E6F9F4|nr:putative cytokinin riboside 5'-monophosphate phosphoribohydrolase LOGL3 isoform [Arachis hypogaea]
MGFCVAGSLDSNVNIMLRPRVRSSSNEARIRSPSSFCVASNFDSVSFKHSQKQNHKAIQTRLFLCKQDSVEFDERKSPNEVREEIKQCYELINRLGRGVVYLGSSRMGPGHPHYVQAQELSKEIANLLDCTSWSGAGPGLMDAVTQGALQAGKPVGGFKIGKEAGEWTASNYHPYLPSENYLTCRFFSARKHGLVDVVVRNNSLDKTAVVALPGGIGTLDEVFEIMALIQLERIGSELPIPFILMNYDSFYSKLLDFLDVCEDWGTVSKGEVSSLWKVCNSNPEALAYLVDFYGFSSSNKSSNLTKLHSTVESSST